MALEIGTVLERADGRRIRLAGVHNGAWLAQTLDDFGPPLVLTGHELATAYGVTDDPAPPAQVDERAAMREADARATVRMVREYRRPEAVAESNHNDQELIRRALARAGTPDALSPEEVFARAAADAEPEPAPNPKGRK